MRFEQAFPRLLSQLDGLDLRSRAVSQPLGVSPSLRLRGMLLEAFPSPIPRLGDSPVPKTRSLPISLPLSSSVNSHQIDGWL